MISYREHRICCLYRRKPFAIIIVESFSRHPESTINDPRFLSPTQAQHFLMWQSKKKKRCI
jgi:hypothetical protein